MSFATDVCEELIALPMSKNCCKKALLYGLFWHASVCENNIKSVFRTSHSAEFAVFILASRYPATEQSAQIEETVRAGRHYFTVSAECPSLCTGFAAVDSSDKRPIWELLGFRCGNCRASFLRGAFIAAAAVNDPHKSYHLEFSLSKDKERRIERLCDVLSIAVSEPRRIERANGIGLYYKTNGAISDLLYYIGATKSSFEVTNTWVERDIRNNENRATNCVARNISRSVVASQKHISAIERLREAGKLDLLPDELRITAQLRTEYDSASLSELALLHEPPISKSGLNQRLSRILSVAEELDQ